MSIWNIIQIFVALVWLFAIAIAPIIMMSEGPNFDDPW